VWDFHGPLLNVEVHGGEVNGSGGSRHGLLEVVTIRFILKAVRWDEEIAPPVIVSPDDLPTTLV
jgi:hypothetical protein